MRVQIRRKNNTLKSSKNYKSTVKKKFDLFLFRLMQMFSTFVFTNFIHEDYYYYFFISSSFPFLSQENDSRFKSINLFGEQSVYSMHRNQSEGALSGEIPHLSFIFICYFAFITRTIIELLSQRNHRQTTFFFFFSENTIFLSQYKSFKRASCSLQHTVKLFVQIPHSQCKNCKKYS